MKLINWFYENNRKKHLIFFGVIALVGIIMIYSRFFGLLTLSNDKVLDMFFYYNQNFFYEVLHSLTDSEILAYKLIHVADYVFAIGFYPVLIILLSKVIDKDSKLRILILLPLLSGLFDILENLMMDIHLYSYPSDLLFLGSISGIFTILKFSILLISIVIFFIFLIKKNKKQVL